MENFNVKRRDVYTFDDFVTDLKKPSFGGPASAEPLKDSKGKKVNKSPKLDQWQNTVERDELFGNQVFNPTYKAMGGDLVNKQEKGKNPYTYDDVYNNMGIPAVNVGNAKTTNEGLCYSSFADYVMESTCNEADADCGCENKEECEDDCTECDKNKD